MPYQPMPVTEVNTRIMTPFELAAGASEIQGNQLTNRLNQRKITELDRQDQQQNALRSLYQQTGGDTSKMREGLIAQGMGDALPEFDKQQRELEKEQRLQEKDRLESAITKTAFVAQKLAPFVGQPYSPEIDQRYQQTKAEIEQQFGAKMHTLPDQYDPQAIQQGYQQGMTVAQQLAQQYKAFDMSAKQQELGLNQQKFQQDVNQKGFENQLNQNKFGYQQQNDAANRQATQANQGWYQAPGPNGLPVWKQGKQEGAPVYSPTGNQNPVNAKLQQQANDANEMDSLIKQAEPLISKSTNSGAGALIDKSLGFVGGSTGGAEAAAKLKVIGGAIVAKMPKPPGPASDRDIQLAKEQGAMLDDPTIPAPQKIAALNSLKEINARQVKRMREAGMLPNEQNANASQIPQGAITQSQEPDPPGWDPAWDAEYNSQGGR